MKQIGVYKITNTVNGKFYIGASNNIAKRWRSHKRDLNKQTHHNKYLQRAWNKHSELAFIFEV